MNKVFQLESNLFKSLANPGRLEILHLLANRALTVGEIVSMVGLSQAAVSQHLMLLRKFRLVAVKSRAQERVYSLYSPAVLSACSLMREILFSQYSVSGETALNHLDLHSDPICGMMVSVQNAASSLVFEDQKYYFCALGCEKKFRRQNQIDETK